MLNKRKNIEEKLLRLKEIDKCAFEYLEGQLKTISEGKETKSHSSFQLDIIEKHIENFMQTGSVVRD